MPETHKFSTAQETESDLGVLVPLPGIAKRDLKFVIPVVGLAMARVATIFNESLSLRDHLPEPFDVPDHIGNTALTFAFMGSIMERIWGNQPSALRQEEYEAKRRNIILTAGVISVAANIFAEKVGYGPASTADPVDFIYGLFGGALSYKVKRHPYFNPREVEGIKSRYGESDNIRKIVENAIARRQAKTPVLKQNGTVTSSPIISDAKPEYRPPNMPKRNAKRAKMQKASRKRNRR